MFMCYNSHGKRQNFSPALYHCLLCVQAVSAQLLAFTHMQSTQTPRVQSSAGGWQCLYPQAGAVCVGACGEGWGRGRWAGLAGCAAPARPAGRFCPAPHQGQPIMLPDLHDQHKMYIVLAVLSCFAFALGK